MLTVATLVLPNDCFPNLMRKGKNFESNRHLCTLAGNKMANISLDVYPPIAQNLQKTVSIITLHFPLLKCVLNDLFKKYM